MQFKLLILLSFLIFTLTCCSYVPDDLKRAEQLMETSPDSALRILQHVHSDKLIRPSNKALYALLMSQALDKNDIKVESDSLISIATDYYDELDPYHARYAWFYMFKVANNRGESEKQAESLLKAQEYALKTGSELCRTGKEI